MPSLAVAGLTLVFGGYLGFWGGVLVGASMVEAAQVSCVDGGCASVAMSMAIAGAAIGAAVGLVLGLTGRLRGRSGSARHSFS